MPKDNISKCYSGRQEDNLFLGVVDTAGGTYSGVFAGLANFWTSSGVLCFPVSLCVIYGGRLETQFW